jgi:arylsulfatase A-like enzyme
MCDQLRADSVGFMGNTIVRTPSLDRLAAAGIVFENLFAQSSVCMASRAAQLTGRYPRTARMGNGSALLDPRETTLAEVLQRAGYRTGLFGKLHLTPQLYTRDVLESAKPITDARPFLADAGLPPMPDDSAKRNYGFQHATGFEDILWGEYIEWVRARYAELARLLPPHGGRWPGWKTEFESGLRDVGATIVPPGLHPSSFIAESAVDFFAKHHRDAPCFMHVSFVDPHHPWDPPEAVARHYPPAEMPLPKYGDPGNVVWPPTLARRAEDFSKVTPHAARTAIAYYYAMIETIDMAVGKVVEAIERAGALEDTLFVFSSDHGELLGDSGLWRKGSYHYDSMIRVPAFVSRQGRLGAGRRIEGLVQSIDLAPTVLGLAGIPLRPGMQGDDLSTRLADGGAIGREWVYTELYTAMGGPYVDCWTLRTPAAKLNYYPTDRVGHLFDLASDPDERHDLFESTEHRPLRDEMTEDLLAEIRRQVDPLPRVLSQY